MNTKQAILDTLRKFARQRPGLEYGNYGDPVAYRSELRAITRDLAQFNVLLRAVEWRDSINADAILRAAESAFSGRLSIQVDGERVRIDYCTGQYFPTEYRRASCAVLSSALWENFRNAMPEGIVNGKTPGERIRAHFRREFGRGIASRYFN